MKLNKTQIAKFTGGGILNYLLKVTLTYLLTGIVGLAYYYIYPFVLLAVIIFSYNYHKHVTYETKEKKKVFYSSGFISFYIIDLVLVYGFTEIFNLNHMIPVMLTSPVLFGFKYYFFTEKVFKRKI